MKKETITKILRVISFIFVIGVTIYLYSARHQIRRFEGLGYPAIFIAAVISNATVILPMPTLFITAAFGSIYNPFWVAVVTSAGATIGELTGYLAGFSGQAVIENVSMYQRLEKFMKKYGDLTILVLAFLPFPVFDLAGITAGILKMPVYRYLLWCWIGKLGKMLIFAYGGAAILEWLPWK